KLYRNIGVSLMPIGLLMTYFLLAPTELMGLKLGATGLAIKMVIFQIIVVNIQLLFNTKFLETSFWKLIGHQVYCFVAFALIAFICTILTDHLIQNNTLAILVSGMFYTISSIGMVYLFPSIIAFTENDIKRIYLRIIKPK
ncbi:MAG: hypothetical protein C0412_19060, partial [Flavobacterium sp.]|nr:hypothetical protein [Flavobacterium sp.]